MSSDRMDDFDRGVRNRRAVLGDEWVDRALDGADAFNAEFQALITRHAWHDIWSRPGLDHATRRLLVLGMTMAQGRWEEFELHCRAAVRSGMAVEKIRETLMQGAIYAGVPSANTAFKLAGAILRAEGIELPPAPLGKGVRVARHDTFSAPQIHVALQGEGAPVVLSHALGLDLSMWDDFAARLAAVPGGGHEVLRYDHRGHGGSAAPAGPYTMAQLVDDAARVIREWGRGPVAFVGLSMGAMVGQGLAIRHPELVSRLVLANTVSRYAPEAVAGWRQRIAAVRAGGVSAITEMVVERYLHAGFRARHPEAAERVRSRLLRDEAAPYVAACEAVAGVDWLARLGEIRCPTLVIAGALDVGAPPALGREIAERIPGAEFAVIDEASHLSVVETPEAFAGLVEPFLAGGNAGSGPRA
jgi:3-oxoadipate enol-lactonase